MIPSKLYHLTWDYHLESIQQHGLLPNHRPNKWRGKRAIQQSKGKLFLCDHARKQIWFDILVDAAVPPSENSKPIWITVNAAGLMIVFGYNDEYITRQPIPPKHLLIG